LYFNRLKQKWNITSNFQLVVVFIVFGITGSMSVKVAKPILDFFNIHPEAFESIWGGELLYWIIRILIVFPAYQVLLLFFGTIFLQFRFFWEFEKKILKRMGFKRFFKEKS
jgi:hypothetical protein|tara:strand:+ start:180 stop:512 length:333 start_codon:yes stop_codon:yes gene_type:complete